jgi:uncharacterized protein (DUF305 family)
MKRILLIALATTAFGLIVAGDVGAQMDHGSHDMDAMHPDTAGSPAEEGYRKAMDTMHSAMSAMPYTGNADIDFVRGMIPHHQAAIDMAKVQLQYGKDPEIRKLSEAIIAAQEAEIDQMEAWLEAHPAQ